MHHVSGHNINLFIQNIWLKYFPETLFGNSIVSNNSQISTYTILGPVFARHEASLQRKILPFECKSCLKVTGTVLALMHCFISFSSSLPIPDCCPFSAMFWYWQQSFSPIKYLKKKWWHKLNFWKLTDMMKMSFMS